MSQGSSSVLDIDTVLNEKTEVQPDEDEDDDVAHGKAPTGATSATTATNATPGTGAPPSAEPVVIKWNHKTCKNSVFANVTERECCGCKLQNKWAIYVIFILLIVMAAFSLTVAVLSNPTTAWLQFIFSLVNLALALVSVLCAGFIMNARCVKQVAA